MSNYIAFGRTGVFLLFIKSVDEYYGDISAKLKLPPLSLFQDPMRLMPLSEMTRYFFDIQQLVDDELFAAKAYSKMSLDNFPLLNNIVGSSRDLVTAIMRLNSVFASFQSGTTVSMRRSGKILKWHYNSRFVKGEERLHGGVMACWIFIHVLRLYHGHTYTPTIVHLPGSPVGKPGEMEAIFSCDVIWNASEAQVWFPAKDRSKLKPIGSKTPPRVFIDQLEVLSFVDMPNPDDFLRCVYELINYSRAFGYPKLENVAKLLEMSPQKLQRKLQAEDIIFSDMVQHQLLCNQAVKMLSLEYSYGNIAESLGFTNQQSFIKAFKRMHGLTPKQYQDQLES